MQQSSPAGILEGTQLTDVCGINVLKSFIQKDLKQYLTAR